MEEENKLLAHYGYMKYLHIFIFAMQETVSQELRLNQIKTVYY